VSARPNAAPFTVGIDVRAALRGPCGIARYSVEVARALLELPEGPSVLLYGASRHGTKWTAPLPRELLAHPKARLFAPRLPAKVVAAFAKVPGFRTELLTKLGGAGRIDAFLHTDLVFVAGFKAPQLVTVHDLAFEVSRDFHDPGFHAGVRERMQRAIARAAAVLVPSSATRGDLLARWKVAPQRVHVVPLGGDHVLRTARGPKVDPRATPRPYLVHVGTLEPRKNLPRLVRAWRAARARGLELDLVLVGPWGWKNEELREEVAREEADAKSAASRPAGPTLLVRGAVDESELRAWLEDATALVYPSLYEGFGLPVVEAFHLGVPVVTSARSATKEVAGDAALLVNPESEGELADAMLEVAGAPHLRAALVERGRRRAAAFTWNSTARAVLGLARDAAGA
jgi:glycosyltransferase involved in cell wall biosynthesis